MSITVSLGKYFEDYLEEKVKEGRYESAAEVVRAGLRLLSEHERFIEASRELDQALEAGLGSEDAGEHEEVMDRALARFQTRGIATRRRGG